MLSRRHLSQPMQSYPAANDPSRSSAHIHRVEPGLAAQSDLAGGLFSVSEVQELMDVEYARCQREGLPLACLLLELDSLERLGSIHGHRASEEVLARVAGLLGERSRAGDLLGYPDHHRLWMMLPHANLAAASGLAKRLVGQIESWSFSNGEVDVRVSVRVGLACNSQVGVDSVRSLKARAQESVFASSSCEVRDEPQAQPARKLTCDPARPRELSIDPSRPLATGRDASPPSLLPARKQVCLRSLFESQRGVSDDGSRAAS